MSLSYTNRQGQIHYFRAVTAAKGGTRYYVTKDPASPDLLDEFPTGFEVYEQPFDARVVFRKRVPKLVTEAERQIVQDAVANLSGVNDFLVEAGGNVITVYLSQFNSVSGEEEPLSADEAREAYGPNVEAWKKYDDYLKFGLVSERPRLFSANRMTFLSLFDRNYVELERSEDLTTLAEKICPHLGHPSFLDLVPPGWDKPEDSPAPEAPPVTLTDFFNLVMNQATAHFEEKKQKKAEKAAQKSTKK